MFALLLWICVAGSPNDCKVVALVDGFVSQEKCKAAVPIVIAGFNALRKDEIEARKDVKPMCTAQANYLINRFGA